MCGLLALIAPAGRTPGLDRTVIERLRDRLAHRGPDDAGYLDRGHVILAHRRLSVIDPTPAGHQPMASADDRFALIYNGELYNDRELRAELTAAGRLFRTDSDTESILAAFEHWGPPALARLRGMYALLLHDRLTDRVLLARDPLGIKPLYYWAGSFAGGPQLMVASEIRAMLDHPGVTPRPDAAAVSAYLTTIRATIGERTLFEGIRTLLPGEVIEIDTRNASLPRVHTSILIAAGPQCDASPQDIREQLESSIRLHLRSDVPICCLLSGGLDSTITATTARAQLPDLWTYCAGARDDGPARGEDDLQAAARMSALLGTRHAEAIVTRELFREQWPGMIDRAGLPLSTPNEVAIHEVARRLRADGQIVTISGEGADELFGGYDLLLDHAAAFETSITGAGRPLSRDELAARRARFQADDAAWIPIAAKHQVLAPSLCAAAENDAILLSAYTREFTQLAAAREDDDPVQVHLRFQRRINLAGLLLRLDSATMLAGVEGRTPFADARIAALAEALPLRSKFGPGDGVGRTKIILRRAYAGRIPDWVISRRKASFPLPFQGWLADHARAAVDSPIAREFFTPAALEAVAARPAEVWSVAWPVINLALWARRWWG